MDTTFLMFLSYAIIGVLFIATAIPLVMRKVPPNPLYGVRLPATIEDADIWYEVNARFGVEFAVAGAMILLSAVVLWLMKVPLVPFVLINTGVILLLVLGSTVRAWRHANRLRDERSGDGRSR